LPSGLAFRVTPAGRRAWFGGIFKGAEADFSMKVTVERAELLKSLGHVHRVVERRNTIPILANVLVKADRGKLSLKATDLDLEVTDSIAAEVSPGGSTTVPAHMFYEIVRKLP
jgi:DNA polymerase-3 subunit beta